MIRHIVLFRWKEGTPAEAVTSVAEGLSGLPGKIPGIGRYEYGPDLGLLEGRFDFALVAEFDDEAGYLAYANHPTHLEVIDSRIAPIRDQSVSVQYRI